MSRLDIEQQFYLLLRSAMSLQHLSFDTETPASLFQLHRFPVWNLLSHRTDWGRCSRNSIGRHCPINMEWMQ